VTTAEGGMVVADLTKIGALEPDVAERQEPGWTEREPGWTEQEEVR